MKSYFLLILITSVLIACGGKKAEEMKKSKIGDFNHVFVGTVGNAEVVMQLTKTGSDLSGQYYYSGKSQSLKLKGSIGEDGAVNLEEFNAKGKMSGKFEGNYQDGKISGNWMKPDGSKSTSFNVVQSTESYEFKMSADWNGKYSGGGDNELTITTYKKGIDFDFALSIVESTDQDDPCTGEVNGKAKLTDDMHAVYSFQPTTDADYPCELKFTWNGSNEISIEEVDCFYYHGARCSFDGTYTK